MISGEAESGLEACIEQVAHSHLVIATRDESDFFFFFEKENVEGWIALVRHDSNRRSAGLDSYGHA